MFNLLFVVVVVVVVVFFFSLSPMNLISYEKIKTFDIFSKRLWQEPIMVGPTVSTFDILDLCMSLMFPRKVLFG